MVAERQCSGADGSVDALRRVVLQYTAAVSPLTAEGARECTEVLQRLWRDFAQRFASPSDIVKMAVAIGQRSLQCNATAAPASVWDGTAILLESCCLVFQPLLMRLQTGNCSHELRATMGAFCHVLLAARWKQLAHRLPDPDNKGLELAADGLLAAIHLATKLCCIRSENTTGEATHRLVMQTCCSALQQCAVLHSTTHRRLMARLTVVVADVWPLCTAEAATVWVQQAALRVLVAAYKALVINSASSLPQADQDWLAVLLPQHTKTNRAASGVKSLAEAAAWLHSTSRFDLRHVSASRDGFQHSLPVPSTSTSLWKNLLDRDLGHTLDATQESDESHVVCFLRLAVIMKERHVEPLSVQLTSSAAGVTTCKPWFDVLLECCISLLYWRCSSHSWTELMHTLALELSESDADRWIAALCVTAATRSEAAHRLTALPPPLLSTSDRQTLRSAITAKSVQEARGVLWRWWSSRRAQPSHEAVSFEESSARLVTPLLLRVAMTTVDTHSSTLLLSMALPVVLGAPQAAASSDTVETIVATRLTGAVVSALCIEGDVVLARRLMWQCMQLSLSSVGALCAMPLWVSSLLLLSVWIYSKPSASWMLSSAPSPLCDTCSGCMTSDAALSLAEHVRRETSCDGRSLVSQEVLQGPEVRALFAFVGDSGGVPQVVVADQRRQFLRWFEVGGVAGEDMSSHWDVVPYVLSKDDELFRTARMRLRIAAALTGQAYRGAFSARRSPGVDVKLSVATRDTIHFTVRRADAFFQGNAVTIECVFPFTAMLAEVHSVAASNRAMLREAVATPTTDNGSRRAAKAAWWDARFALEARLSAVVQSMHAHCSALLRCVMLPLPSDAAAQRAIDEAVTHWAESDLFLAPGVLGEFSDPDTAVLTRVQCLHMLANWLHNCSTASTFDSVACSSLVRAMLPLTLSPTQAALLPKVPPEELDEWADGVCRVALEFALQSASRQSVGGVRQLLRLEVGNEIVALPWEGMPLWSDTPAVRLVDTGTTLGCAEACCDRSILAVVNPSGDLADTAERFTNFVSKRNRHTNPTDNNRTANRHTLCSVAGDVTLHLYSGVDACAELTRKPSGGLLQEMTALRPHVFMHCGHGGAEAVLPRDVLLDVIRGQRFVPPVAMLMGCSSAAFVSSPFHHDPVGTATAWLHAGSCAVVGCTMHVTDGDCDRLTEALLDEYLRLSQHSSTEGCRDLVEGGYSLERLAVALLLSRRHCKLRHLTGSVTVCFAREE